MKTNTEGMSAKSNSNQKHRWYDVIVAWAEGKEIQYSSVDHPWRDYTPYAENSIPAFNCKDYAWRIKPKTVTKRYRMALVNVYGKVPYVKTVDITESCIDEPAEYNVKGFIRWLGEPVEVELEVNDENE